MILRFFEFTYLAFGAISLYAGVVALSRIIAGRPFEHWSILFLKSALAVSITGLLLDIHRAQPSHLATMLSVYIAGVAILAWLRYSSCLTFLSTRRKSLGFNAEFSTRRSDGRVVMEKCCHPFQNYAATGYAQ